MANERGQGVGRNDRSQRQQEERGMGNELSERGLRAAESSQASWVDEQEQSVNRSRTPIDRDDSIGADRQPREPETDPNQRGIWDQDQRERQTGSQRQENENWSAEQSSSEQEERGGNNRNRNDGF